MIILLIQLIVAVFLIRFHVNFFRLNFNPVVDRLNRLTDPIVMPFKKLLAHPRFDYPALLVALIIALLCGYILSGAHALFGVTFGFFILFLTTWLNLVMYALFLVVIASWLQTDPRQPLLQIALALTEWIMAPLRRVIPSLGGLDFSPILVLLAISFAKRAIIMVVHQLTMQMLV